MPEIRRILPYLARYRRRLALGVGAILVTHAFGLAIPWILKRAIDALEKGIAPRQLAGYAALLVAATAVAGVFRYLMRWLMIGVSRRIEYDLRGDLFAHLQGLDLGFFHRMRIGDLMARATNDMNAVRTMVGPGIMYLASTLAVLPAAVALMLVLDRPLTGVAMIPMALLAVLVTRFGAVVHRRFERVQAQYSALSAQVQETLAGMGVVKAYVREAHQEERFAAANRTYLERNVSLIKVWALFMPMMGFMTGLAAAAVLWVGGRNVIAGRFTLGDFVAFNGYLAMLAWPVISLGWVINMIQRGTASLGRIGALMDERPAIVPGPRRASGPATIAFRDVSFAYPGGPPVLAGIDLEIAAGETVAVVGPTGSGKSTLAALIPRLVDARAGRVEVGGVDVRELDLEGLRRRIGFVPQETFLFSTTMADNIAYGVEDAGDERLARAAGAAQILATIDDLPERFAARVGERGVTLSGGQRQRTAIARALIRDPEILILDDALASVDTDTEEAILRGLRDYLHRTTAILISHRVTTVREADRIVVLAGGRIVEQGSHRELLARDGAYACMFARQLLREQLEAS